MFASVILVANTPKAIYFIVFIIVFIFADDYTDEEVEEFSEVLYTMQPDEVAGWNRSLILRGINLPNQIKDEVISFLS